MSSTSMTVPPPAIGWNVQDSDRFLLKSGSVVMMSLAREYSTSCRMSRALASDIVPAATQASQMSDTSAPRCTKSSDRFIILLKR